ncbi:MAG: hypothetical protein R3F59_11340, partial [Myxococcota bacterium]
MKPIGSLAHWCHADGRPTMGGGRAYRFLTSKRLLRADQRTMPHAERPGERGAGHGAPRCVDERPLLGGS